MPILKQLLEEKGYDIWSIPPKSTVFTGLEIMAEKNIGALMVIDDCGVVGIFTERDYCRKVILKGKNSYDVLVDELMTTELISAGTEDTLDTAMALMTSKSIRHLPVFQDDKLIGIVTLSDVTKFMLSEKQVELDNMENFIYGGYKECQ
jgi:CBS domain-containing protein